MHTASLDTSSVPGAVPEYLVCADEAGEKDRVPCTTDCRLLDASQMRGIQRGVSTSAHYLGRSAFEAQESNDMASQAVIEEGRPQIERTEEGRLAIRHFPFAERAP